MAYRHPKTIISDDRGSPRRLSTQSTFLKMKKLLGLLLIAFIVMASSCTKSTEKLPMGEDGIVRLSRIEVYPEYLDEYLGFATEVGTISLQTEPGQYRHVDKFIGLRVPQTKLVVKEANSDVALDDASAQKARCSASGTMATD